MDLLVLITAGQQLAPQFFIHGIISRPSCTATEDRRKIIPADCAEGGLTGRAVPSAGLLCADGIISRCVRFQVVS